MPMTKQSMLFLGPGFDAKLGSIAGLPHSRSGLRMALLPEDGEITGAVVCAPEVYPPVQGLRVWGWKQPHLAWEEGGALKSVVYEANTNTGAVWASNLVAADADRYRVCEGLHRTGTPLVCWDAAELIPLLRHEYNRRMGLLPEPEDDGGHTW